MVNSIVGVNSQKKLSGKKSHVKRYKASKEKKIKLKKIIYQSGLMKMKIGKSVGNVVNIKLHHTNNIYCSKIGLLLSQTQNLSSKIGKRNHLQIILIM